MHAEGILAEGRARAYRESQTEVRRRHLREVDAQVYPLFWVLGIENADTRIANLQQILRQDQSFEAWRALFSLQYQSRSWIQEAIGLESGAEVIVLVENTLTADFSILQKQALFNVLGGSAILPDYLARIDWYVQAAQNAALHGALYCYVKMLAASDFPPDYTEPFIRAAAERLLAVTKEISWETVNLIGFAYEAGTFSHRETRTRFAQEMQRREPVDDVNPIDYLRDIYARMMEEGSLNSKLAIDIARVFDQSRQLLMPATTDLDGNLRSFPQELAKAFFESYLDYIREERIRVVINWDLVRLIGMAYESGGLGHRTTSSQFAEEMRTIVPAEGSNPVDYLRQIYAGIMKTGSVKSHLATMINNAFWYSSDALIVPTPAQAERVFTQELAAIHIREYLSRLNPRDAGQEFEITWDMVRLIGIAYESGGLGHRMTSSQFAEEMRKKEPADGENPAAYLCQIYGQMLATGSITSQLAKDIERFFLQSRQLLVPATTSPEGDVMSFPQALAAQCLMAYLRMASEKLAAGGTSPVTLDVVRLIGMAYKPNTFSFGVKPKRVETAMAMQKSCTDQPTAYLLREYRALIAQQGGADSALTGMIKQVLEVAGCEIPMPVRMAPAAHASAWQGTGNTGSTRKFDDVVDQDL